VPLGDLLLPIEDLFKLITGAYWEAWEAVLGTFILALADSKGALGDLYDYFNACVLEQWFL